METERLEKEEERENKIKWQKVFANNGSESIIQNLPPFASPQLIKLLTISNAAKSFEEIQIESSISLPLIYKLVSHLVFWKMAKVVYPLKQFNVYIIHSKFRFNQEISHNFSHFFPKRNFKKQLSKFSFFFTIEKHMQMLSKNEEYPSLDQSEGDLSTVTKKTNTKEKSMCKNEFLCMVLWFLKHDLITQVFAYIYMVLPVNTTISQYIDSLDFNKPLHVLFSKLHIYFNGKHSIEEIIWKTNCTKHEIDLLLEHFSSILFVSYDDKNFCEN